MRSTECPSSYAYHKMEAENAAGADYGLRRHRTTVGPSDPRLSVITALMVCRNTASITPTPTI